MVTRTRIRIRVLADGNELQPMNPTLSRRTPRQNRSAETVKAILDAASALLSRIPVEQITTSRIAEQAGLSVGGLYRFYSDKQEVFDAIAVREMEDFREQVRESVGPAELLRSPETALKRILDAYIRFLDERPHFRTLALGRHISETTREKQTDPDALPGGLLQYLLVAKFGWKPRKTLRLRLRIAAEAGDHLIALAYAQKSERDRAAVIDELKRLLVNYLLH